MGGIIIATNGIFARKALNIATGTLNFTSTQTILFALFQTLCPGLLIFFFVLNKTDETYSKPPDCSIPDNICKTAYIIVNHMSNAHYTSNNANTFTLRTLTIIHSFYQQVTII